MIAEDHIPTDPLLEGSAQFVADVDLPNQLYLGVIRSHEARGVINEVEVTKCLALPGIVDAFTASDMTGFGKAIPLRTPEAELEQHLQPILAAGHVLYVGEPVAAIVGTSPAVVEDAIGLANIEIEPEPPYVSVASAIQASHGLLHEGCSSNVAAEFAVNIGDIEAALAEADITIEEHLSTGRHTGAPMDPGGVVASWAIEESTLTMWGATKVPHANRLLLSGILNIPPEDIRLIETYTGGGFGIRGELYPEEVLAAVASIRVGQPVKWIPTRRENFLSFNHSREQSWLVRMGVKSDGTIVGVDAQIDQDTGAYVRHIGTVVARRSLEHFLGPYAIANYRCHLRCVLTNKTPIGPYRSPGNFEATFVRERMVDLASNRLGIERVEFRRRNIIATESMPFDTGIRLQGNSVTYDSGDFKEPLDAVVERMNSRASPGGEISNPCRRGTGVALFVDRSGFGPPEYAQVRLHRSGDISVHGGAPSLGQGHEVTVPLVVAEVLGQPVDGIYLESVDTAELPAGGGTFASRGAVVLASAVYLAAEDLRGKLIGLAAQRWNVSPTRVGVVDGQLVDLETKDTLRFADVIPKSVDVLSGEGSFQMEQEAYSYGALGVEVAVDMEIGTVYLMDAILAVDVGRVISYEVVLEQLKGALAQGIGGALLEDLPYDESGQPLVTSFLGYAMPTSTHAFRRLDLVVSENYPTPLTPLGAKGAGELGIVGVGGAVANAIADAVGLTSEAALLRLPLMPATIREAITADHGG